MTVDRRDALPTGTGAATSVPALATVPAASRLPRVVIVGAGFGGLAAAKALKRAPVEVTVIDRRNYHLWARNGHQRWLENREEVVRLAGEETWRLFRLLFAGTAGVMNDPAYQVTAYRMVLELPADSMELPSREAASPRSS